MSAAPSTLPPRGAKIFVNYRREDASGYAGRLYEWLSDRFGRDRVFRDINAIEPGADFVAAIENEVASCEVVLVVIGRQWLGCASDGRRRLDNPNDFVRLEIASALARGVHILPVLVEGARMPREHELPDDLRPLARRQALEVSETRWEFDVGRLIEALEERLGKGADGAGVRRRADVPHARAKPSRYRQRSPARLLAGLLILIGALAAQAYFAFRPRPVRVENVGEFSPVTSKLGRHELTIKGPLTNSEEGLLLYHGGKAHEMVEVEIDGAILDGETLMQFSESNPPTSPALIAYRTAEWAERSAAEPCRTFVEVRLADKREPPSALRLYQLDSPGGADYRHLLMKAEGGGLLVNVTTESPDDDDEQAAGCRKVLKVGPDFERQTTGTYSVGMVAERGAALQFRFNPAGASNPLWDGPGGLFQPFDLGAEKLDPSDPPPFRASAVELKPLGGRPADPEPLLSAHGLGGDEFLSVESLKVGPDSVQIDVSGRGLVRVDGRDRVDLLDRIKANPIPPILLALCDAALIFWFTRLLFGRQQPSMR
jgi:hypothetical protein